MTRFAIPIAAVAAVTVVLFLMFCVYTVDPTEQAIVLFQGKPEGIVTDPGLHAVYPGYNVVKIDRRLLNLDAPSEEVIAQESIHVAHFLYANRLIENL